MKENKPTSDFSHLVQNGIEFLEMAIRQIDESPKHSVINFHTAVEIFLKVPLVHEHWSLVVADRDPNRRRYEAGDFLSVTFDEACKRLEGALNKPLRKSAKTAFDIVRQHRNRMVHFYHGGVFDDEHRDQIKLEQARAWFELNRFVMDVWPEVFQSISNEFRHMEYRLIAKKSYANAKYEDLKPKIEGMTKGGAAFENCPSCETSAYTVEEVAQNLTSCNCLVCFESERKIKLNCPECGDSEQYIKAYEGFSCKNCGYEFAGEEEVLEIIEQNSGAGNSTYSCTSINCDECQGFETVINYHDGYVCRECFSYFKSVSQCEWCSSYVTGEIEDSYTFGCEYCDGYAGHHADD